jgi:hypothetical protein
MVEGSREREAGDFKEGCLPFFNVECTSVNKGRLIKKPLSGTFSYNAVT